MKKKYYTIISRRRFAVNATVLFGIAVLVCVGLFVRQFLPATTACNHASQETPLCKDCNIVLITLDV